MHISREHLILGGAFAAGFTVGFGGGYVLAAHIHASRLEAQIASELEGTRKYYDSIIHDLQQEVMDDSTEPNSVEVIISEEAYTATDDIIETLKEEISEEQRLDRKHQKVPYHNLPQIQEGRYVIRAKDEDEETVVAVNVFSEPAPPEPEVDRDPTIPYLITEQEFFANESDFQQGHLTFYVGDEALSDEKDELIPDHGPIVGTENLLQFGWGTNDENAFYVRNERLQMEFEVTKSEGKYSEEVLGFIRHQHTSQKQRRFRHGDDD